MKAGVSGDHFILCKVDLPFSCIRCTASSPAKAEFARCLQKLQTCGQVTASSCLCARGAFVAGNRRTGPGSPFYDNVMLWAIHNGRIGVNMTYRLAPKDP